MAAAAFLVAGCGDGDAGAADGPTVVVSTSILGDVVEQLAGGQVDVVTVMPRGADPHAFQPSARDVARIREADALVVNGGGFEEALLDVVEAAEADGVPTFEAVGAVATLEGEAEHDHGADDDHDGDDPHFFTDPSRMVQAARGIEEFLATTLDGVDVAALEESSAAYIAAVDALDAEVDGLLAGIPEAARVLVTSHDVFGYFADRYDFEVLGTVIPGGSSADAASAGALAELARVVEREDVPAVFVDTSSPAELARAVADEVGQVEVVELYTESLGARGSDGGTYLDMMRTNARRIADALHGRHP